jgi:glycosyltransferase involved in cell wall biosynthesis
MLAAEISGIPFSYTLHGPAELFEPRHWAIGAKTARARFTACISHYARSQAMFFSDPAHWDRLPIVHCGVIPELYERSADAAEPGDGIHLVFVGRLTAIKGVRVLLEALRVARAADSGIRLTLVGDGDDRPALEALAAAMGDAVRFAGYRSQEEVANILATADVFVLPSFAEGVPVVLMEAMAAGKPVIATRIAGVPELVEDGESGLLVPPGDAASLGAAIARLAGDPAMGQRMGKAGRAKVRAEFDVRKEAAWLLSLFRGGAISPRPESE